MTTVSRFLGMRPTEWGVSWLVHGKDALKWAFFRDDGKKLYYISRAILRYLGSFRPSRSSSAAWDGVGKETQRLRISVPFLVGRTTSTTLIWAISSNTLLGSFPKPALLHICQIVFHRTYARKQVRI